jgi:hypothetical protein
MAKDTKKGAEVCYGCGAMSDDPHPIFAVVNKDDVDKGYKSVIENPDTTRPFVGVPVCSACHKDPAHRTAHQIKGHFFERVGNMPKVALMLAGSNDIGG